eukprot:1962747-Alexandrium_andersonii.AAC.1
MSASLVGSEMCIRDRLPSASGLPCALAPGRVKPAEDSGAERKAEVPRSLIGNSLEASDPLITEAA